MSTRGPRPPCPTCGGLMSYYSGEATYYCPSCGDKHELQLVNGELLPPPDPKKKPRS